MSKDSRWSCGPTVSGDSTTANSPFYGGAVCAVEFDLNVYRYVRQIQIGELEMQYNSSYNGLERKIEEIRPRIIRVVLAFDAPLRNSPRRRRIIHAIN